VSLAERDATTNRRHRRTDVVNDGRCLRESGVTVTWVAAPAELVCKLAEALGGLRAAHGGAATVDELRGVPGLLERS